jgi:hypothetical protein
MMTKTISICKRHVESVKKNYYQHYFKKRKNATVAFEEEKVSLPLDIFTSVLHFLDPCGMMPTRES